MANKYDQALAVFLKKDPSFFLDPLVDLASTAFQAGWQGAMEAIRGNLGIEENPQSVKKVKRKYKKSKDGRRKKKAA